MRGFTSGAQWIPDGKGRFTAPIQRPRKRRPTRAETWKECPFCCKCSKAVYLVPGGFHFVSGQIICNDCAPAFVTAARKAQQARARRHQRERNAIRPAN